MHTYVDTLKTHGIIHREEEHQICSTCGKLFTDKDNLKTHGVINTKEKHQIRSTCGKLFTKVDTLKSHEFIHPEENPQICSQCGEFYTDVDTLKTHRIIHRDDSDFFYLRFSQGIRDNDILWHLGVYLEYVEDKDVLKGGVASVDDFVGHVRYKWVFRSSLEIYFLQGPTFGA